MRFSMKIKHHASLYPGSDPTAQSATLLSRNELDPARRVLLLTDREGWAFGNIARQLAHRLEGEVSIRLARVRALRMGRAGFLAECGRAGLVVGFYWGACRQALSALPATTRCGCLFFDEASIQLARPDELARLHLVMASNRRFAAMLAGKLGREVPLCEDGVDTVMFRPVDPIREDGRLRVLWTGNSRHGARERDLKGFHTVVLPACRRLEDRVQLVVRDRAEGVTWPHESMPAWYNGGDVLACASSSEGTPNPILEAAACGRPCVTTEVGIVPEAVAPGRSGLVVERSVAAFAEALEWLSDRRPEVIRMGTEARARALEWDWNVKTQAYREAFLGALRTGL